MAMAAITNYPLSLNDLYFPLNPFNVMTATSAAPITEAHLPHAETEPSSIQEYVVDMTYIPMPSMLVSSIGPWETPSNVGTSDSDEPGRISLTSSPPSKPPPPRPQNRQLSMGMSLPQNG